MGQVMTDHDRLFELLIELRERTAATHERVAAIDDKIDAMAGRLSDHESSDKAAHARITDLETSRTKLYAYWTVIAFAAPAIWWVASEIWKVSAKAL
jgi:hypothetical protein